MNMNKDQWLAIVDCISSWKTDFNGAMREVRRRREFDTIPNLTVRCIFWQTNRFSSHADPRDRKQNATTDLRPAQLTTELSRRVVDRHESGCLLDMSRKLRLPPYTLAKAVASHMKVGEVEEGQQLARSGDRVFAEAALQLEVEYATLADEDAGPISCAVKACLGNEYELKLKADLDKLGISYVDETELRRRGYDKTPDIKLELPISVNGRAVNWIESKAIFGDCRVHKSYLKDQLWSYWNRFGSGLVIYWAGFVTELNESSSDAGILLAHDITSQHIETLSLNMNRSMEAHAVLKKKGFSVDSFGTGEVIKLPGSAADRPNVYEFGTSYETIFTDLSNKDYNLYTQNGVLNMLERNKRIKVAPNRMQEASELYDVILTAEERVYDKVIDFFNLPESERGNFDVAVRGKLAHVINIDIQDNHEEATIGAFLFCHLVEMLASATDLDDEISDIIVQFENTVNRSLLNAAVFY